jgi:uncharacterized RDD family membrane protein YckC
MEKTAYDKAAEPYVERSKSMRYRPRLNGLARNGITWICAGALLLIFTFLPFKLILAGAAIAMIAVGIRICGKSG